MSSLKNISVSPGLPLPLGAHITPQGVQFAIFSRHATSVILVLFETDEETSPYIEIPFDPEKNKTGDIWHILVRGIGEGQLYGYRIDGPYDPKNGHRFNKHKLLIDPYARALTERPYYDFTKAIGYNPQSPELDCSFSTVDSAPSMPRCIVVSSRPERTVTHVRIPERDCLIYELHVKGFTCHPSSGVRHPGTFRGLTEKIPYLQELGVTSVELMPVQEFNPYANTNINPVTGERLTNFWGYDTVAFFAPHGRYASSVNHGSQVEEFREMVQAFHEAGMEVILDVVFNHTAEGDETGPTLSFRGIDNTIYYMLKNDRRFYRNFSGCGNTVNCNHPLVRDFILNCLRYWVIEMNIDGFRFDLASILGRDQSGEIMSNSPLIEKIGEDPILRNAKIIAEAWDAAGAYQVGEFPSRWAEWNGRYRDDVRRFWRGDPNTVGAFATRLTGSSDLYGRTGSGPLQSVNFITCHDGFTLNDLVSYRTKRNRENGEDNRDGEDENFSFSWGAEGPDINPRVSALREQMIKNFLATLLLSQGIPMILAGDEFRRTQKGNNNAYCQDNEISWVDWRFLEQYAAIHRFTKEMIRFRKEHPALRRTSFFTGKPDSNGRIDLTWHGVNGPPDWGAESRFVAMRINGSCCGPDKDIFIMFNAGRSSTTCKVPPSPSGRPWRIAVDTSLPSPEDIRETGKEPLFSGEYYQVSRISTVVLVA